MSDPATSADMHAGSAIARPVVVGANHRSSTMTMRDRIFVEEARIPDMLAALGEEQAILLSTCDRVEAWSITPDADGFAQRVLAELAREGQCDVAELEPQTYILTDAQAVDHLFRVTASLDSLMVGEPQILGQVKQAHRIASSAGFVKAELETWLQAAYAAAKRVRSETRIGEGPVSMAASATQIARDVFGDLERSSALLIGAGDMGELIARDLIESGITRLSVTHPRESRANALARDLDAHVVSFDDLSEHLLHHDIILSAMGSRRFSLGHDLVGGALKARRFRPLFIVDAGVPGDVEPEVEELDEAFVYGLGDLEQVALKGRAGRAEQASMAEDVIEQDVATFMHTQAQRVAVPTLTLLRKKFESERDQALADAGGDAEKATRLLLGRLLHGPSQAMRDLAADDEAAWARLEFALEKLFDLKQEDQDEDKS